MMKVYLISEDAQPQSKMVSRVVSGPNDVCVDPWSFL